MALFGTWPVATHDKTDFSDTFQVNGITIATQKKGSRHPDVNGGIHVYVEATNAAQTIGDWVTIDELGNVIDIQTTVEDVGDVGVMQGTVAKDDFGWAQIYGNCTIAASVTVGDDAPLFAQAAGVVDDAVLKQRLIHGAFSRAASATSHTAITTGIECQLTYPQFNTGVADTILSGD